MKLKDVILDREETIAELSTKIGVSRQTLYNIENDKHTPSLLVIKKICKYFGRDYKDFV